MTRLCVSYGLPLPCIVVVATAMCVSHDLLLPCVLVMTCYCNVC